MDRHSQQRILVIDSDEHVLRVIENFLVGDGFDVTTACGAEKALNSLQSGEYDLVLVDEHFADLTSSCFLTELLRIPQKRPVIVMEAAPSRPCGIVPHNSLRVGRFVSKWRPCEILEAARDILQADSSGHVT